MLTHKKNYLPVYPKFDELVKFIENLIKEKSPWLIDMDTIWQNESREYQLMLQTYDPNSDDFETGVGKLGELKFVEKDFKYIQPSLKNTVIDDYLNWVGVPVYRARVMSSRPKSAYSFHKDFSPRIHLPLITNNQCYFLFKDPAELIHMPADGTTTWTDTRFEHSFMNGSMDVRLHIVCVVDTDYKRNLL